MPNMLVNEIRENFAAGVLGFRALHQVSADYPAWTVITPDYYAVAVPNPNRVNIREGFASVRIESQHYLEHSEPIPYILLSCTAQDLRYEFASIAAQFVEPGVFGSNRDGIQTDPFAWWKRWRELIGNRVAEKQVYPVIGEMLVLDSLLTADPNTLWGGPNSRTHDIDTADILVEVKSSLQKYKTQVTISSQHQLDADKPLWLYFIRMEPGYIDGVSIESLTHVIHSHGYPIDTIMHQLDRLGVGVGTNGYTQKYRILEKRRYLIDEHFPRIVPSSFKGDRLPDSIVHVEYTVDLEGLHYEQW